MSPKPQNVLPLPPRRSPEQYRQRAREFASACAAGDDAVNAWAARWVREALNSAPGIPDHQRRVAERRARQIADFARERLTPAARTLSQAQFVIARALGFASWPALVHLAEQLSAQDSTRPAFERAAAGVQTRRADLLLERGARMDAGIVCSCLMNGWPEAAAHLAERGARLDMEAAGGIGRLDFVARHFEAPNSPSPAECAREQDSIVVRPARRGAFPAGQRSGCRGARPQGREHGTARSVPTSAMLHWSSCCWSATPPPTRRTRGTHRRSIGRYAPGSMSVKTATSSQRSRRCCWKRVRR
jgi:hypothetical protein